MGYISQFEASDIDSDDIDLRFEVDGVETGTTVSIVDERGHAAQIITALLDEMEKAQCANVAQDDYINQQQDRIEQLEKGHQEAAKHINSWRRLAKQNIAERGKDISELEAARQRIAELEHSETQLINERDSAESSLNDAYKAVMGQAPEWSNWFSFENAIEEMELACELWRNQTDDVIQFRQRITELEAKLETADRLQDSAFRDGLKAGFSYGQTDDQSGFTQCMSAYSPDAGIKVKGE
ncbi:ead/Ea22-like family protein [Salmonella enterica subsp. diarizonae]|nr:ead/Ea22-like family protein [Salmonella enterica subsp. diarizonae]EDQ7902848.1 ead/Ea22-like family protein [Salmonella enterica subsp. diarizonae]